MKKFIFTFIFFCSLFCSAQNSEFILVKIADSLKQNANAVLRLSQIDINIASQGSMDINNKRIVTILNEKGLSAINAYEYYDKKRTVRDIQATVYDGFGNEIKKIKRKDFRDLSATDGGTFFADNRYIYLDYTPIQYPFTIVFESKIHTSNTAFIPRWFPLNQYLLSVEKSVLNISYPDNLGFKKEEFNFSNFKIIKTLDNTTQLSYTATNIPAQKEEFLSPIFENIYPYVMMGLELFNIEGVDGNAKTWKEFGKWYSDKILAGTLELAPETKEKIKKWVGNEKDPIEKAKKVYQYLQNKSRYVSIQVGIGGWKPMFADDVDRLGYGDCKALSNYTRALLAAVDVPSYNTLLYGDQNKRDIKSDFVSMQGNHMILCIPDKDKNIFLECTSQDNPFGYQANFTDDRDVFIFKPEGGEIVHTKNYQDKDNSQVNKGKYNLDAEGHLSGVISMVSEGSKYGYKTRVEKMLPTEKEAHYKDFWSNISNLKLDKITFSNDKEKVSFTENLQISADNYGKIANNKMIFVVNAYSQNSVGVKRIRNRKTPFEIQRGYCDTDEIAISLPTGFGIESMPAIFELNTKFGEYQTEIIKKDNSNLIYKRSIFIKKGMYKNTEYDEYRLFMEQISKNDNAKIILTKN